MFDPFLMRHLTPVMDRGGRILAAAGISANAVTWTGFAVGLGGAAAIAADHYGWGLGLILANRAMDGLDGAVARASRRTDLGGYLDIVLDFIFYGVVTAAFAVADPARAVAAAFLLASFMATAASFLGFAIIAARRGLTTDTYEHKSFFFSWGLAEGGETIAFLVAVCIWPTLFTPLAYVFATLCWITAVQRIALARDVFK